MSWFSPDVLGGDEPMNVLSAIGEAIGEPALYPLRLSATACGRVRAKLEASGEGLIDTLTSPQFRREQSELDESLPVLAACFLATGAAMPEGLRRGAAEAARRDPVSSPDTEWSSGRLGWPQRRGYMQQLAEVIERHQPGEVVDLGHVGLTERMLAAASPPGSPQTALITPVP